MTERPLRSATRRLPRVRVAAMLAVVSRGSDAWPSPPECWRRAQPWSRPFPAEDGSRARTTPPAESAQIVEGPAGPGILGLGSLELTTAANPDFAGVAHPFLPTRHPVLRSDRRWLANIRDRCDGRAGPRGSVAAAGRLPGRILGLHDARGGTSQQRDRHTECLAGDRARQMTRWSGRPPTTGMGSASRRLPARSRNSRRSTPPGDSPPFRSRSARGSRR